MVAIVDDDDLTVSYTHLSAAEAHTPMPVTEAAFQVNSEELSEHNEDDFSAVVRRMEEVAGVAVLHPASIAS